jgi:hypothetical protein
VVSAWALFRLLVLWTIVCGTSAIPSFLIAQDEGHDVAAMVSGVGLFIVAYTVVSSLPVVQRIKGWPHIRTTLIIGYSVRVGVSVFFPAGFAIDLLPGMMAVGFAESLGLAPRGFAGTLVATLVQGILLNILLGIFMAAVYAILRATRTPPDALQPRGCEVILRQPPSDG